MANIVTVQTLTDATKKAVIKLTGIFDGSGDESNVVKIQGRNLTGALANDVNNAVLVSNGGTPRTNYNYSIARIVYNTNITGGVRLTWSGSPSSNAVTLSGTGDWNTEGTVSVIPNNAANATGNILLSTANSVSGSHYSIMLELHKGPNQANSACDFNMGQIQRPSDFNFGTYGVKP